MAKIDELKFDDKNFNKHTEYGMSLISKSLQELGAGRSILIDKDNNIIAGNGIVEAAGQVGLENVKIVETDGSEIIAVKRTDMTLDSEKGREMALADNATASADLEWDKDTLGEFFEPEDVEQWGVDLDWDAGKEIEEDEAPEVDESEPAKSVLGEVYQLGEHRLMCGDSTDAGSVAILMNGEKADMVFTDPPYGMKKEKDGVLNDNLNYDKLLDFNKKWIPLTFDNLKDNGSWYCWGIDEPLMDIYSNILKPMQKNKEIAFRNLITWDKGSGQGQMSEEFRMYPIADEKCLFVMVGGDSVQGFSVNQEDYSENMDKVRLYLETEIAKLKQSDKIIAAALGYKDGRTVNHWRSKSQFALPTKENYEALREYGRTVLKDYDFLKKDYDSLKKDYDSLKKDFYAGRSYFDNTHDNMNNVWHFGKTSQEERNDTGGHATPKPIALCSRAIKSSSREGGLVLDVFGGSGSTLIACEQLGRRCYMMELDPKYCDVIRKRWWKFTHDGTEEGWEEGTPAI